MKTWDEVEVPAHWFDYQDLYDRLVDEAPPDALIVEVGAFLGRSTAYLGLLAQRADKGLRIVTVDRTYGPDPGGLFNEPSLDAAVLANGGNFAGRLVQNLIECGVKDHVMVLAADSYQAVRLFQDSTVWAVMIDGDHHWSTVARDLVDWWPKVQPGGYFTGHDYGSPDWPGVQLAVDAFAAAHPDYRPLMQPPLSRNCWSGRRRS